MWHLFIHRKLYFFDAIVSATVGTCIGYEIQLSADSGERHLEALISSLTVGLFTFLFAFVIATLINLRFRAIPYWLLLTLLGPLLCVIGLRIWRYQTSAVGPELVSAVFIFIPFFIVLLTTRCVALVTIFVLEKYRRSA